MEFSTSEGLMCPPESRKNARRDTHVMLGLWSVEVYRVVYSYVGKLPVCPYRMITVQHLRFCIKKLYTL